MADGGQRLLDVIDDPNALESFLGGLTADAELLPSAETVDNVVASLARSLDDNEYEVDSPNETLFDTLDSSNHLTDISRSYVPSDFDHVAVQNDVFSNNLDGFSNGGNVIRGSLPHHEQQGPGQNSGCDQFIGASSNNNNNSTIINSVISASSGNTTNNTTVTGSTIKQLIAASVPNCDPSKSTSNFVQAGQLQLTQNSVSSGSNNLSYVFSSHDLQQHNKQIEVSHNQLNQVTSLSSVSLEGQQIQQQNVPSNSTNNLISAVGAGGHENGPGSTLTNSTSTGFQIVTNQQSGQGKAQQNVAVSQNVSAGASVQVTSGAGAAASNTAISSGTSTSNVTLSTTTNVVGSNLASIQHQQQYIANTSTHQAVNHLMSGQTVSIPGMTVGTQQLIANSQGLVAASVGQNILQQIQSAGASQYIAMEQPTALMGTTFGTNVALMATGGTPTYAVLPTTPQFLTNAIIPQPTIQTLTKAANGAYYQTTGTPQIVATSTVNALQNVSVANATSDARISTIVKTKQPPQLLPKPLSQVGTAVTTSNTTTPPVTSVSSSTEANSGGAGSQQSLPTSMASTTVTDGVMTQLIQQSQHQLTNVSGTGTVAITPQQSYSIGNAGSLGQVVVSQVGSLSTMTTPQQAHQLSGTIVVNQFGQPMLLPTASTAQSGLQLILRQQPAQPQVLTIQAPNAQGTAQATTATSGKPVVRYVSQMPQLAQTSGYGLQQIQTANGPTWVAVRYPQASQASQFSQIQADSIINASSALQSQIATSGQTHLQLQTQQSQQLQIQLQQQQQTQQLIQQSQQQQIHFQTQQQVQAQNQFQAQQQLSLQNQSQVQFQNQQGQISNVQQQIQSQHMNNLQQNQAPTPMETQNMSTPTHPNQFTTRSNQTSSMHQSVNNSPQTQQFSREVEQQQISVPDSSSEPPPPKKAKTKSKSSKKKVTLDLEQLLKQSGIMDEDLQDDMSFDFGFGSMMDTPPNGLPLSPQVPPPAQIPVINTTETPKKPSKKKSNSKKSPAQPPPPPPVVLPPPPVVTPSPSAKKKRSPPKKKNAPLPPPTPPPPLPPPPPTVTPTKSKSSKKKSSNSSGIVVNENQKSEPKTTSSKKNVPPKKVSSLDTLLATIDAVAAAAGASYASSQSQSSPSYLPPPPPIPSQPTTPSRKPTPSPKSKSKSKSKSAKNSANTTPSSKAENLLPNSSTMTFPAPSTTLSQSMLPTFPQSQTSLPTAVVAPTPNTSTAAPPPPISPVIPTSRVTGANLTNGSTSVTTSQTGLTRVVQTIQLTPQNQQLLRNIQGEINRLYAIPKRNDSEQAALQKLHNLQQQIIATGTPVPNPTHLNNLAQIVNVESISLATPSATVPSSDTASTSSSSAIAPLVFPCESDLTPSPVSSTVVATTAMSVLSNANLINSSPKLISSKLSANCGSSPVVGTAATAGGGGGSASSNGACIIVGSPSVSSTASPDSTSNLASNLNVEPCSVLPSTITTSTTNNPTPSINSGGMGMGSVVVSNVKPDLGQLVASLSVAPPEDKNKDNTQGKGFQGVTTSSAPVPVSTQSSLSFSQHLQHVPPPPSSYVPSTFSTRSVLDEKKAEEQRQSNLKAEEEKRARWKKEEFEMLLQRDQQYVVKPDYEVPFESKKDAVGRLMKYHIYRDRNDMNFEEFDAEFGNNSGILLEKFSVMMSKYRNLLLKESTKEVGCAERVMLERMFVSEEKIRLEQDRMLVAQGDVMELPPPPESWVPKIKEMVDKEMIEFEPQDPVVSQQVQSAVDSIIGCGGNDTNSYILEEGDKIEYDAFGVPINSSGYAGLAASSADIDEAVRSILS